MEALPDGRCVDVNVGGSILAEFYNFGMAQKARGAVSSVPVRHVRIAMSRELKKHEL